MYKSNTVNFQIYFSLLINVSVMLLNEFLHKLLISFTSNIMAKFTIFKTIKKNLSKKCTTISK